MKNQTNKEIKILFAKGNKTVKIPTKNTEDAGYDIYANFEEENFVIPPHKTKLIPTNLASVIPPTHYFQLEERGSTGTKGLGQRCGVIDSGFRNMWFVPITNHNDKSIVITKETNQDILENLKQDYIIYPYTKAICQAILLPVPQTKIEEISMEDLLNYKSKRGIGMLGSSNK